MKDNLNKKNMKKPKKSPQETGTNGVQFKPLELEGALLGAYDLMTRVLLQNEMIATHDTARCIHDNLWLQGDGVDLAIPYRMITDSVKKTLQEWVPDEVTDSGITTKINGVPVRVQFVKNEYDYFKMADVKPFGAEFYKIPNQWEEYWKNKEAII